jgi:hypothetical protein
VNKERDTQTATEGGRGKREIEKDSKERKREKMRGALMIYP